ncbi:transporter substrate-binding domain-containing protein [Caproiciproducens galactitolivorans]|uniref:Transporter substrate-binding domain-containing protein n=1 Tax=Caproiciproducens galactitolivorans TaxID=642589 RepID=A0ABT4BRZ6_9FIRM|nr:transporter substrate-binding domain-containing protein [Caproiciproducens galactitolivorans]MCY1713674.1 transporter substrate-binding domain-containing protein [Caproiciproducens galactitolivorans]
MKFTKRILPVLLCAVLTAGLITMAGCTKSETAAPAADGSKKVLKVGMECNYAPYNWTQADNSNGAIPIANSSGEYTNGYDVMMAKKIADSIGYDLQIVKTEWDGLAPSVVSGKLDAVIAGMSITEERKKTVDFTDPYYKATIYALVRSDSKYASAKSVEDLKGASCTSQQNTVWYDMLKQIPDAAIQPAMKNVPALIVSLTSGKTDVFVTDKPTAMGAVYANKKLVMLDFQDGNGFKATDADVNLGIAVSKSNPELKAAVNKALSGISEADRDKIMQDAIAKQPLAQ